MTNPDIKNPIIVMFIFKLKMCLCSSLILKTSKHTSVANMTVCAVCTTGHNEVAKASSALWTLEIREAQCVELLTALSL